MSDEIDHFEDFEEVKLTMPMWMVERFMGYAKWQQTEASFKETKREYEAMETIIGVQTEQQTGKKLHDDR